MQAKVLGISADSISSHKKFGAKHTLPFTLLADEDKSVSMTYGAYGEKKFMGRIFTGIKRVSFLIDPQGNIAKVYTSVKPKVHAEEVLSDLQKLI